MEAHNINYESVLGDLKRRRQELDAAIAAIERIVGQGSGGGGKEGVGRSAYTPTGQIRPDEFFGMTIPAAIKKYLEIMKRPRTATDIAKGIKDGGLISQAKNFYANVATALRRMDERGRVVQIPDTKQWGLAAWYPSKPRRNGTKKKDDMSGDTGADPSGDTSEAPEAN